MSRTARCLALTVAAVALLSGCSEEEPPVIDVGTRITTAEDALECPDGSEPEATSATTEPRRVHEDAPAAVHAWAERIRRSSDIPIDGYQVSIEEVGKVLFVHETDNRAEIAVVVSRTESADGDLGWVTTSWARCRPSGASS